MANIHLRNASAQQTVWFSVRGTYPYPMDWSTAVPSAYIGPASGPLDVKFDGSPVVLSLFRSNDGTPPFCTYPVQDGGSVVVNADPAAAAVSVNNVPVTLRRDQRSLSGQEQQKFLSALRALNFPPPRISPDKVSRFGAIVDVHAEMVHDMHGYMGPYGVQRFLPWHRIYLLQLEQALQSIDPTLALPYWDWTADRRIPDWIAQEKPLVLGSPPIQVVREPDDPALLPTPAQIEQVLSNTDFTAFTSQSPVVTYGAGLEGIHNGVHRWFIPHAPAVPSATMNDVPIASADPIFWMHHANLDRLWTIWQFRNPTKTPSLPVGEKDDMQQDASVMDPWLDYSELRTRVSMDLNYAYDH